MQEERAFFLKDATRERADLLVDGDASSSVINAEDEVVTKDRE
jgi:hypothetical protein